MMTEGGHAEWNPAGRAAPARVLLVTGMSGAGRSTALKLLEDMGYEAFDNLPLSLFPALIESIAADEFAGTAYLYHVIAVSSQTELQSPA